MAGELPPLTREATLRLLRIIWVALVISILIYGAVLMMISRSWQPEARPPGQALGSPFVLILGALALGMLMMAFVLPQVILRRREKSPAPPAGPGAPVDPMVRTAFITRWALIESVAIYGLIGSFFVEDVRIFFGFAAVSLAGFVLTFPTEERLIQ